VQMLDRLGYTHVPTVGEVAEKLIEAPDYVNNPVVMRMKSGERLDDVSGDILSKRRYRMKMPWAKEMIPIFIRLVTREWEGALH